MTQSGKFQLSQPLEHVPEKKGWLGGKECQRLRFQNFILVDYFVKGDAANTVALLLYALAK